ncbi:GNAT family N-acetyltransferase [Clostridium ganghwense]|uniref:GNAT family N-acetyltransferase n=1 Tax=Clostridium ganghwense TaxID=312089 RepID=A0ABT4CQI7_9CLOT|nr:GNAT family N-acetyltransferase [Clostridium ganghwense]MCY6371312.1 GNAT family N-acetyltransferase [Clostridium ganghwense]
MVKDLENIFLLTKAHIKPAVETLTKAFENDPVYSYLIPDEEERKRILPHLFQFRMCYGITYGEAYAISPDVEGLAVWIPHKNAAMTPWRMLRCGGFPLFLKAGKSVMTRLSSFGEYESQLHKKYANFPHLFLSPIAVDPVFQGRGFARTLLKDMFERVDREKLPCFLQTQSEYNVSIYEKYGFRVVEQGKIPGTNLSNWAMIRHK